MTEDRDPAIYLDDILDAATKARRFVAGLSFEQFESDDRTSYAVLRALEIVGEAAKQVPQAVRHRPPDVPWQDMAGMRDTLIPGYHGDDRLGSRPSVPLLPLANLPVSQDPNTRMAQAPKFAPSGAVRPRHRR